ncbi:MAG: response regulator [Elusimicrobiales bacterium]|nr:response regulator [Elusimicrobiales bacterium]
MKKILIVDDEQDYVNIMIQLLEPEGYGTLSAGTAKDALKLLEMLTPDLMILDWNLPDKTGLELLKEVRSRKKFRRMRIVMNTIRDSESDQLAAYLEDIDLYFTKPIKPDIFLGKIKKLLG